MNIKSRQASVPVLVYLVASFLLPVVSLKSNHYSLSPYSSSISSSDSPVL